MVADQTHYSSHKMSKSRKDEVLAKKEQKTYMMIKSVGLHFIVGRWNVVIKGNTYSSQSCIN